MFHSGLQNVDLFWVILLCFIFLPEAGCRSADADSCHEVKTAYMMRQIGPVELVPERPGTGQSVPLEMLHTILIPWEISVLKIRLKYKEVEGD